MRAFGALMQKVARGVRVGGNRVITSLHGQKRDVSGNISDNLEDWAGTVLIAILRRWLPSSRPWHTTLTKCNSHYFPFQRFSAPRLLFRREAACTRSPHPDEAPPPPLRIHPGQFSLGFPFFSAVFFKRFADVGSSQHPAQIDDPRQQATGSEPADRDQQTQRQQHIDLAFHSDIVTSHLQTGLSSRADSLQDYRCYRSQHCSAKNHSPCKGICHVQTKGCYLYPWQMR